MSNFRIPKPEFSPPPRRLSSKNDPELFFFTLIATYENPGLVDKFLDHYLGMGIPLENMHVDVQLGTEKGKHHDEIVELLIQKRIRNVSFWKGPWSDSLKRKRGEAAHEWMGLREGDWILHVDSDEFQEYPLPLYEMLKECEKFNITIILGSFVDRIAEGGEIIEFDPKFDLESSFPWACQITKRIVKGMSTKLGPFKFGVTVESGGYHGVRLTDPHNIGRWAFRGIRVHHFKWIGDVLKELENRKASGLRREARNLLKHVQEHKGRICVECPETECFRSKKLPDMLTPKKALEIQKYPAIFQTWFKKN